MIVPHHGPRPVATRHLLWPMAMLACALSVLALDATRSRADSYSTHTAITSVAIQGQTASEVWLAGSDHALTCTTASDTDCNETTWETVDDSVTHYWTGTGTFKNDDNVGTSVTYFCANTAGSDTIAVHADDDYSPENNTALADDSESTDTLTVTVIIPVLDEITYGGGNFDIRDVDTPEYSRTASRDGSAAWRIDIDYQDGVTATSSFWHTSALTEAETVYTYGSVSGDVPWVAGSTVSFGTTWPSGSASHPRSAGSPTAIGAEDASVTWKYKCPNGTDTYIDMTTHNPTYYYVRNTPVYDEIEACYALSCEYCDGMTFP
jgi:hypothetical protein